MTTRPIHLQRRTATSRKSARGLTSRRRIPAPTRRFAPASSHGLVGRVQAMLPGTLRNTKTTAGDRAAGALSRAMGGTTLWAPVTKSMVAILGGGVGAFALALRRHTIDPNEATRTSPALSLRTR
jgi:hypothetical protein